jgi:hypothetical protein
MPAANCVLGNEKALAELSAKISTISSLIDFNKTAAIADAIKAAHQDFTARAQAYANAVVDLRRAIADHAAERRCVSP